MHPIERLRYVARAGDADPALLAEEAAEALGSLAREPRALVPACRRLLEFHPTCGPLWWVCARLLVADDLRDAAGAAVELLIDDPTAEELAASIPGGSLVAAAASALIAEALGGRPDLTAHVVGPPSALRAALRRAGDVDVTGWESSEVDDALEGAQLVIIDALAAGPAGYLIDRDGANLAAAAARAGIDLWVAAGEGRVLPAQLYEMVVARAVALPDPDDDEEEDDDVLLGLVDARRSIAGRFVRRAVAIPRGNGARRRRTHWSSRSGGRTDALELPGAGRAAECRRAPPDCAVRPTSTGAAGIVERYLWLGLGIGRHIEGFVDAYYGPPELRRRVESEPVTAPLQLVQGARDLLAAIDAGEPLGTPGQPELPEPSDDEARLRRHWLRAQVLGLLTSARILAGDRIEYADEVEACYGVRPSRVPEETILAAHADLDEVMPGAGSLAERVTTWREAQAVPPDKLEAAIASLAEDLRERTAARFGLPDGETVTFELVTNKPWSGFNYYLGELRSRVAINVDLPVLSTSLAHLVAHEAYPGHHTEHSRKEVGLVRRRRWLEESIFLVGTPQCLLAEGLADLGLEIVMGRRPEALVAEHLRPLGIPYDPDTVAVVAEASEALSSVRSNAAFRLHEDGADREVVAQEIVRFALTTPERARKSVEFLCDPTWHAYISCYVEGLRACRQFVGGRPERFARLLTEQLTPADLLA